ncbi:hypothetical protein KAI37_00762 [Paenibacillus sp. S25]|nr:hypothetical protein KAI37_00762 [Paenibacillus sp. S25]
MRHWIVLSRFGRGLVASRVGGHLSGYIIIEGDPIVFTGSIVVMLGHADGVESRYHRTVYVWSRGGD